MREYDETNRKIHMGTKVTFFIVIETRPCMRGVHVL